MATFDMNRRGGMTVNRDSLHASPEYKRQVDALDALFGAKPMNDEITNRLFETTEKYECLLRAVKEHHSSAWILDRAEAIQAERGLLKEGEDGRC